MMTRVLFVCLGNICRSPLAEAIFDQMLKEKGLEAEISCDSSGTGGWHVGELPDPRTRAVAQQYGVPLDHRGRQFSVADFETYDYIVAMDQENYAHIKGMAPHTNTPSYQLHLMRDFDTTSGEPDVPDPYWGGEQGFDDMYHLLSRSCAKLLAHIQAQG